MSVHLLRGHASLKLTGKHVRVHVLKMYKLYGLFVIRFAVYWS